MNGVCKDIFRAIHEGKWLSIAYKNKDGQETKYWIGIKGLDFSRRSLTVDGLHLGRLTVLNLTIYIDSILSSSVLEGTYCPVNQQLVDDIRCNPHKYRTLFEHVPNLQILNYLADCYRMDAIPYQCDYALIERLDGDSFAHGDYTLDDAQFCEIVKYFQYTETKKKNAARIKQLALNVCSIPKRQGLYVLAYQKLHLDVKHKSLRADDEITVCREFTIDGEKQSIRQFLDVDEYDLLNDFKKNAEQIKDCITKNNRQIQGVDDMPYLIAIGMDFPLDLNKEYGAILGMYHEDNATIPVKAFFGDFLKRPVRRKDYPPALLDKRVNLDQLLAINNAMKYPLSYVQGPPGTGKTNTILNTILTAFFNGRTVLFASFNNHPIDGVFDRLQGLPYKNTTIPFPMVRLGNQEKVCEALRFMRQLYEKTRSLNIFDQTLNKNRDAKIRQTQQLTSLLKQYEEILDLRERREVVESLLNANKQLHFQYELHGRQLAAIDARLKEIGEIRDEDALKLLTDDTEEFKKYLYYTSAKYIKRLDEPKNKDLLDILYLEADEEERVQAFHQYLSSEENVKKFLRVFPIVATTCISAHRIGGPKPYFDMVIMDEASQCNTAVSLVPVVRGNNLMLVGDPQQLNPVILLDPAVNQKLRKKYAVSEEYDYISNSIYKTYLACDAVSDEVLLRHHYRCHPKIIEFNNKKYYNGKLKIESRAAGEEPLVYVDMQDAATSVKNTSPSEVQQVLNYIGQNSGKKIGIITPFANQRKLINEGLREYGYADVTCGTVHAFQGDEKDVILFSLGITDQTHQRTYDWLKNNKELINVAVSRPKEKLVVLASGKNLDRLHNDSDDDLYELIDYVRTKGTSKVTQRTAFSRALGIKPYSTETEAAFLENLNHAMKNILPAEHRYVIHKEVSVAHVFRDNPSYSDLFYTGRFDFVVYERTVDKMEIPVLAIELDGKEHAEDATVKKRDRKKQEICKQHNFELIRVENSYARRYHYIKEILIGYFGGG